MEDKRNMEMKDEELEAAVGGCCYHHEDGSVTEVFFDDAPDEGTATFKGLFRSYLEVGTKGGSLASAVTENGLWISGIIADGSQISEGELVRFKKIDRSEDGGFAQYWFYKA